MRLDGEPDYNFDNEDNDDNAEQSSRVEDNEDELPDVSAGFRQGCSFLRFVCFSGSCISESTFSSRICLEHAYKMVLYSTFFPDKYFLKSIVYPLKAERKSLRSWKSQISDLCFSSNIVCDGY